ncbi:bifunctional 4-hydroxy-2-oxoglutarate aldolase/2-dehydro-3-deoxy-phosphogluconate aldolase [Halalkalibacterium ligniniphilum]|uniref:bifunctional 4-hydroxy-2-oxoglutarate aldolase/2-dehydro-3-deoxy-phosphogluconate aldolase n=1 Tax=Halalkalibacterium ligniniphilum TaxID=1134413 RepID=UPI00034BB3F3|nr:bifunctional 4-hydroxy-2-oxoglutarate aldolase/2-dehydro-3-deoxy-phosphogluconate aldolase [Halalkalibacterium ligniniphilum]
MSQLHAIQDSGIVAVIRGAKPENMLSIADALYEGGVRVLEITVETPKVLHLIEEVKNSYGEKLIVGAGTVLDAETARATIMAGAEFIFSPNVDVETIRMAKRYGVISIPGALTPTEILTAYEQGADMIKVFPAGVFGPRYLKDIQGPLPHIPLMPTGGVGLDNIADYIKAGAVAAGLGSSLVNAKKLAEANDYKGLTEKAKQFVQAVKEARHQ